MSRFKRDHTKLISTKKNILSGVSNLLLRVLGQNVDF